MLLGDWLILIGAILFTVGVTGLTQLETSRGSGESDLARSDPRRRPSITRSIQALLLRWRPEGGRPAALRATTSGPRVDAHDRTDYLCRLADGSMGRVAIIGGTDEEWTAVCVPA
jgi:hypothetical protein